MFLNLEINTPPPPKTFWTVDFWCGDLIGNKVRIAQRLQEVWAIPAILYGSQTMVFSDKVIKEFVSIQVAIGAFILQIPQSSFKVIGWVDEQEQEIWD